MAGYILNTDQEKAVMLEQIKRSSLDDLYAELPANLKLKKDL